GTRFLRNFESPYVSLQLLNQKSAASGIFYRIVLRKLIWDPRVEEAMLDDPGAVLLLYKQAVNDFRNGHLGRLRSDVEERLRTLEEQGSCIQVAYPLFDYIVS
ncbi:PX domain-containing protein F17H10.3, partial [Toxocara canis]